MFILIKHTDLEDIAIQIDGDFLHVNGVSLENTHDRKTWMWDPIHLPRTEKLDFFLKKWIIKNVKL
jgi:hypothetical protein